jgi:hypothetical protein
LRRRYHGWQLLATSLADLTFTDSLQLDLFILQAAKDALLFAIDTNTNANTNVSAVAASSITNDATTSESAQRKKDKKKAKLMEKLAAAGRTPVATPSSSLSTNHVKPVADNDIEHKSMSVSSDSSEPPMPDSNEEWQLERINIATAIARVLSLLFNRFATTFRPPLENFLTFAVPMITAVYRNQTLCHDIITTSMTRRDSEGVTSLGAAMIDVLYQTVSVLDTIQRQQANQRKVFDSMVTKSLSLLMELRGRLSSNIDDAGSSFTTRLVSLASLSSLPLLQQLKAVIERTVLNALFSSEHITGYASSLQHLHPGMYPTILILLHISMTTLTVLYCLLFAALSLRLTDDNDDEPTKKKTRTASENIDDEVTDMKEEKATTITKDADTTTVKGKKRTRDDNASGKSHTTYHRRLFEQLQLLLVNDTLPSSSSLVAAAASTPAVVVPIATKQSKSSRHGSTAPSTTTMISLTSVAASGSATPATVSNMSSSSLIGSPQVGLTGSSSSSCIRACLPWLLAGFLRASRHATIMAARDNKQSDDYVPTPREVSRKRRLEEVHRALEFAFFLQLHTLTWHNYDDATSLTLQQRLYVSQSLYGVVDTFHVYRINQDKGRKLYSILQAQVDRVFGYLARITSSHHGDSNGDGHGSGSVMPTWTASFALSVATPSSLVVDRFLALSPQFVEASLPRLFPFLWSVMALVDRVSSSPSTTMEERQIALSASASVGHLVREMVATFVKLRQFDLVLRSYFTATRLCPATLPVVPLHQLLRFATDSADDNKRSSSSTSSSGDSEGDIDRYDLGSHIRTLPSLTVGSIWTLYHDEYKQWYSVLPTVSTGATNTEQRTKALTAFGDSFAYFLNQ